MKLIIEMEPEEFCHLIDLSESAIKASMVNDAGGADETIMDIAKSAVEVFKNAARFDKIQFEDEVIEEGDEVIVNVDRYGWRGKTVLVDTINEGGATLRDPITQDRASFELYEFFKKPVVVIDKERIIKEENERAENRGDSSG